MTAARKPGRRARWGAPALGLAALVAVNGLLTYGLIYDRARLIDAAAEASDAEAGMYESYLRRAVAGWDEILLALGDRLRAGDGPDALRSTAAALIERSLFLDGLTMSVGGRTVAMGFAATEVCVPGPAGLRLRRVPADDGGFLVLCRSFGGGVAVGGAVGVRRLAAALADVKENWASSLEVSMTDGGALFVLPSDDGADEGAAGGAEETAAGGERLSVRAALLTAADGRRRLVSEHAVTGYPLTVRVATGFERVTADWRRRAVFAGLLAASASVFFVGGVVLSARQAAARERLLAQLATSEAEATAIFERAFQLIALLDTEGRIRRINRTTEQAFGVTAADVVGRLVWDTVWADLVVDRDTAESRLKAALATAAKGEIIRYETRLRGAADGDFRLLDVVIKPVCGADGAVREVLLEARDVTEITRARESLLRSERLAALGGLVAGIAHEVNTPVGVATTSASHLAHEVRALRKLVDARRLTASRMEAFLVVAEEAAELTLANCDRAARIVNSFKQVAVDQIGGERRRFRLAAYIDEVLTSLRPRLKREPHRIEVDCPDDLELDTDAGALSHGLTNLVINALTHAFEPGQVGLIRINARSADGDMVKLVFSDDGRGIPAELHEQVFDPFFTTRRGAGGSGLGLHILHAAITGALRGRLRLESGAGKGTSFIMIFPRSPVLENDGRTPTDAKRGM